MAVDALITHALDLIEAFLPGVDLLARVNAVVEGNPIWLGVLHMRVEQGGGQARSLNQRQLQEQTSAFLRGLSAQRPLLLLLDDRHWVDADSVSLLFHLARSLAGSKLLLVGAYRQEEVQIGRDSCLHPLKILLAECKRFSGDHSINLNRLDEPERRDFIELLIDTERNRFDADFRQAPFKQTKGHALFTVETLRELQTRGDSLW